MLACYVAVGLSAFWLHDSMPAYLIWQKLAFICGGLFVPLDVYPSWLRNAAAWTPFPTLLYAPAQFFLTGAGGFSLIVKLCAWALVLSLPIAVVYRRGLRALEAAGG